VKEAVSVEMASQIKERQENNGKEEEVAL